MTDLGRACLVPRYVSSPEEARAVVEAEGAAIVRGIESEEAAIAYGWAVLGAAGVRVSRQIEATKSNGEADELRIKDEPADARGRKRDFSADTAKAMPPHNDGFAFGDYAPERLFLFSARAAVTGGESFLIDGGALLDLMAEDPANAEFVEFATTVDIDHTEPSHPQLPFAPIARSLADGRRQVRHHPYLAPVAGPAEAEQWPMVERWHAAVCEARDTGPRFLLETGDMAVVDNYRVLHGRHGHSDPDRRLYSIWGWTTSAIAVPAGTLDIVEPGQTQLVG
ncbi:TauD/TfdA family dioxygenase [Pseudonocardia sp. CA-107938]|uniref:TauD/TfdA family dioxygenase n=1 Tax=Pseudonocardia sp. CA-107938 TaxID=3240021 RepID=UPI003D930FA4